MSLAGSANAQYRPTEEELFGDAGAPAAETKAGSARAKDRPTEEELFGDAGARAPAAEAKAGSVADPRDNLSLGNSKADTRLSVVVAPEDPLKIGGQLYLRLISTAAEGQSPGDWKLSAPALLDVYLDARPNDRVRAFVLGRMSYDPTLPRGAATSAASLTSGLTQTSDSVSTILGQATRGPNVVLDQLWLRFDLVHLVFVTLGTQHVTWGTGHFWTPTDYLHLQPRNPLLPFDPRTGTTMLKFHVPWGSRANLYAYAVPDGLSGAGTLGDVAVAGRAEVVVGTLEAGAGVFARRDTQPKFASDVSFGIGDFDFYGEAAVRNAADVDIVHYQAPPADCTMSNQTAPTPAQLMAAYYPAERGSGWKLQAVGGLSYALRYADKDTFTMGAEYFYNGLGYSSSVEYPGLFFQRDQPLNDPATFFYLGQHYLGVFASAPAPFSLDTMNFRLSSVINMSDQSGIGRLDYSLALLTHIVFEAYSAAHFGRRHGEFRGATDLDLMVPCTNVLVPYHSSPLILDFGLGLRVAL